MQKNFRFVEMDQITTDPKKSLFCLYPFPTPVLQQVIEQFPTYSIVNNPRISEKERGDLILIFQMMDELQLGISDPKLEVSFLEKAVIWNIINQTRGSNVYKRPNRERLLGTLFSDTGLPDPRKKEMIRFLLRVWQLDYLAWETIDELKSTEDVLTKLKLPAAFLSAYHTASKKM
jgi:hypothetical protein